MCSTGHAQQSTVSMSRSPTNRKPTSCLASFARRPCLRPNGMTNGCSGNEPNASQATGLARFGTDYFCWGKIYRRRPLQQEQITLRGPQCKGAYCEYRVQHIKQFSLLRRRKGGRLARSRSRPTRQGVREALQGPPACHLV